MSDIAHPAPDQGGVATKRRTLIVLYLVAFVTGAIVMSFEMLGSRYLNPYFGSGIHTWSALISTVLAALAAGYFLGGWLADRHPSAKVLGLAIAAGSAYLVVLPAFAQGLLEAVARQIDDVRVGSLCAALALTFPPITLLGMYSPFAIRLVLRSAENSGSVSGAIYGISTVGSIVGTWTTTFALIPNFGTRAVTVGLGLTGLAAGALLMLAHGFERRARATLPASLLALALALGLGAGPGPAEELVDPAARRLVLAMADGEIAHLETEYNDIFITKSGTYATMSFQRQGFSYTESATNLLDDDELPVPYTQTMTIGAIYPPEVNRALMIGLGGGSLSTYLARHFPGMTIDNVEVDPGVIAAAKKYFGLRETSRVRFLDADGRVFLIRHQQPYDLILIDAFRGGYVPFHMLTKEFYLLLKQRLSPGGVAVFNIHGGTRLYTSTLLTLKAVFPSVDLYEKSGSVIAVVSAGPPLARDALAARAAAGQRRYRFRYPMDALLAERLPWPSVTGDILTDDFAPADVFDVIPEKNRKQW